MRRHLFPFIVAVMITAIGLTPALVAVQQSPRQLFERARIVEEANQDLMQAIRLYEQAAAQSKERALSAEALLRMAGCYEKLGSAEARRVYEEVVSKYKDQSKVSAQARLRLEALSAPAVLSGSQADRLLWTVPERTRLMPVTTDGRWIGTSTPTSGSIRNVSTGEVKLVVEGADGPLVSPDGKTIVYNFHGTDSLRSNDATTGQLRIMGVDSDSKPRVLLSNSEIRYSLPVAWALDGKSVLLELTKQDGTWQIGWVSIVNGSLQVLKSLDWRLNGLTTQHASLSPDGRYIAYSALAINPNSRYRNFKDSNAQDIYILTANGLSEKILTKTGGINEGPVWTPDGTRILFTSDRSGTFDLYSVAIQDGEAAGFPSLVKKNVGRIIPVNTMTKPGTFYYLAKPPSEVHIGEMDPKTMKFRGFAAGGAQSFIGMRPTWSPDGDSVAFTRQREDADAYDLVIQTLKVGTSKVYPSADSNNVPLRQIVQWFHDGKALVLATNSSTGLGLNRIDLNSGRIQGIGLPDRSIPLVNGVGAISADDQTIYLRTLNSRKDEIRGTIIVDRSRTDRITGFELYSTPGDPLHFSMKSIPVPLESNAGLASGEPQQSGYVVSDGISDLALSPDAHTFALTSSPNPKTNEVYLARIAASNGREYRKLYGPFRSDQLGNKLAWTADGRTILFAMSDSNDRWKVMRIPADGGNAEFTGLEVDRLRNFDLSPDGSRIAFEVGADPNWEVRALDYVSSISKTGR